MVGVGLRENAASLRKFAAEFRIGFPLWMDPAGKAPVAFDVVGHPNTILIDRVGRIVGRVPGERDWTSPDARRLVEWLLSTGT